MSSAFQELKERFKAVGTKLSPEARETAKQVFKEWLATHNATLAKKNPSTEFNGTMMQWFHWYIPATMAPTGKS
jgi:alpha-amylase